MKPYSVITQDAIILLNEASRRLDPAAIRALVTYYAPFNYELADQPTIEFGCTEDGEPRVGKNGIVNGFFGFDEDAYGPVHS